MQTCDLAAEAAVPTISDRIGLTHAPRELASLTGKPGAVSYRQLYVAALDGRVPAELQNGRWSVRRSDLPAIAAAFGLTPAGKLVTAA